MGSTGLSAQTTAKLIETKLEHFKLRFAQEEDIPLILCFVRELAEYEGLSEDCMATEEDLHDSLFHQKAARVIIGEYKGSPAAFAVYFHNFSTLVGRPGIHIEDIYVRPEMRGKGMGRILFSYIAKTAVEERCGRLEWWCLNWNEAAIQFYKHLKAVPLDYLTVHRLHGDNLQELAEQI